MLKSLTKGDSDTLGFVIASLYSGAINKEDLRAWAIGIIRDNEVDNIPGYIFELANFDDRRTVLPRIIGFSYGWKSTKFQHNALYGIALKQGKDLGEECLPKVALEALKKYSEVEERFRETFPFINFKKKAASN